MLHNLSSIFNSIGLVIVGHELECLLDLVLDGIFFSGILFHLSFFSAHFYIHHNSDLMSFDELSSTSEKLSHPTANRPKMPGRRLPAQFAGGQSVSLHPDKRNSVQSPFEKINT